jgi:hypothetical protein
VAHVLTVFREGFDDLAFFERDPGVGAGLAGFEVLDPVAANALIRRIAPWEASNLRGVLERRGLAAPVDDAGRIVDELSALVSTGLVVVARRQAALGHFERPGIPIDLADLAESAPAEELEPPPVETFAAFRLVDDVGNPIAEQPFTLELPDGRTVEGVTGPDGRFEVDPVASRGHCVLRFAESA